MLILNLHVYMIPVIPPIYVDPSETEHSFRLQPMGSGIYKPIEKREIMQLFNRWPSSAIHARRTFGMDAAGLGVHHRQTDARAEERLKTGPLYTLYSAGAQRRSVGLRYDLRRPCARVAARAARCSRSLFSSFSDSRLSASRSSTAGGGGGGALRGRAHGSSSATLG